MAEPTTTHDVLDRTGATIGEVTVYSETGRCVVTGIDAGPVDFLSVSEALGALATFGMTAPGLEP